MDFLFSFGYTAFATAVLVLWFRGGIFIRSSLSYTLALFIAVSRLFSFARPPSLLSLRWAGVFPPSTHSVCRSRSCAANTDHGYCLLFLPSWCFHNHTRWRHLVPYNKPLHLTHTIWRIKGKLWPSSLSLFLDQEQYHCSPICNPPHHWLFWGWFHHISMGCNTTSTDKVTCSLKGIGKVGQEASCCLWQAVKVTDGVHTTQLPPPILSRTLVRAQAVPCPPLSIDRLRWGWHVPGAATGSNWEGQQSHGIWRLP